MSRHHQGDRGILMQPLPTLCCGTIPAGMEIEVWRVTSPKRALIKVWPPVPFLFCGHSGYPPDNNPATFERERATMPKEGPLPPDDTWPKLCPVHKVKLSGIWFVGIPMPPLQVT